MPNIIRGLWSMSRTIYQSARASLQAATYKPKSAIIFLTYRCTSRCTTCNIWQRPEEPDRELTWAEWRPALDQLVEAGIEAIELFGGDALLRKELLFEMIRYCNERGIRTFFPTNSSSLTEQTVGALVDAGLHTIYLSIDEVPEIEGQLRGISRHYERVEKAIECIQRLRGSSALPRIECITTVSATNFLYVPRLL